SDDYAVQVGWGGAFQPAGIAAPDPRLATAGWRALAAPPLATDATIEDWDRHRLGLGLPDASRDLVTDQTVLLEAGYMEVRTFGCGCTHGSTNCTGHGLRAAPNSSVGLLIDGGCGNWIIAPPSKHLPVRIGKDRITLRSTRINTKKATHRPTPARIHAAIQCSES
ncbi:MAG: hypothetical protein WCP86_08440, partial [bacterium]